MNTSYHAKFFAHELTRRQSVNGIEKLSMSLFDACVDLNPHQVEAALFAFRSPLARGSILADEVGLGKTIEAGLVLCQYWAERSRKLLVICPASLRKQWSLELKEKFNLPAIIMEAKSFREALKEGSDNPFEQPVIVITSLNFASGKKGEIRSVPWDLVVIDEAHKLRNAYRPSNRMGQNIRWALADRKRVLLTATPLQNSLLELYGLSTLIDEYIFGDLAAFRAQYVNDGDLAGLRKRLRGFCIRTLRSQVLEYIRYTERRAITRTFRPTDQEQELYQAISAFLQQEDTCAIPKRQQTLTTLILRKLLASSSQAVAGTLETIKKRLEKMRDGYPAQDIDLEEILDEEELAGEILEEDGEDEQEDDAGAGDNNFTRPGEQAEEIDLAKLNREIAQLKHFIAWARSISVDSKSRALLTALEVGFAEMENMGANRKALIFTESRRTQDYLRVFLEANGYAGRLVLFNGTNSDPASTEIYKQWVIDNIHTGRSSGSRTADIRAALMEHFRDRAEIMIATESAAEGVNLQFCSLVVNYDLPWNPQRIEQRIGRCHRYGQKYDVVVINFLNERNEADLRVYELLQEKFNLFSGVFGASDEVIGTIESGVDFERRILNIYQQCRTQDEIEAAFKALQEELEQTIKARLEQTRRTLLENFDEDVHARLKLHLDQTRQHLDRLSKIFWDLTRFILAGQARFDEQELSFELNPLPDINVPTGYYKMISRNRENIDGAFLYRLSHPLGEYVLDRARSCPTPLAEVVFDVTGHPTRISVVESLKGQSGCLVLAKLTIDSFDREEHLLFNAVTDAGQVLDQEICEKLFQCRARVNAIDEIPGEVKERLSQDARIHAEAAARRSFEESNRYFQEERERLETWADDLVLAAEKELKDTKAKIKVLNRQARQAASAEEQHQIQLRLQETSKLLRRQRQRIFEVEDEIMDKRDQLIDELANRLNQRTKHEILFIIRWQVV